MEMLPFIGLLFRKAGAKADRYQIRQKGRVFALDVWQF
jgi:hypothetical protein